MKTIKEQKEEIVRLHDKLRKPSKAFLRFAEKPFEGGFAYQNSGKDKGEYWCADCGQSFQLKDAKPRYHGKNRYSLEIYGICPHCGRTIRTTWSARNPKTEDYISYQQPVNDEWSVTRYYWVKSYSHKGDHSSHSVEEVQQIWTNSTGKHFIYRRKRAGMFTGRWWTDYDSPNGWKHQTSDAISGYYGEALAFNGQKWDTWMREKYNSLPELLKSDVLKHIDLSETHGIALDTIYFAMSNGNPHMETLWKAGQYGLFAHWAEDARGLNDYWDSIKICIRNHYTPKNPQRWCDLVHMLTYLGMDTHSPHYVCPKNEKAMHDMILKRMNKKKEEEELAKKLEEDMELRKRIAKYLDMEISNKHFDIIVLPNIKAFKEEGDHLGHCVYRCKYYSEPNSLILSARDKEGHRVETIEVYLDKLTIHQCYGYGDTHTKWHKEIMNLMNKNMWQVKERRDGKKMQRAS